jgi:hypothetical protein
MMPLPIELITALSAPDTAAAHSTTMQSYKGINPSLPEPAGTDGLHREHVSWRNTRHSGVGSVTALFLEEPKSPAQEVELSAQKVGQNFIHNC